MASRKSKLNLDNITELTTESKTETKKAAKTEPKEQKEKPIKNQDAYLKLDLMPKDCPDLKKYILKQKGKLEEKTGKNMSVTRYIQNVLIDHVNSKNTRPEKYEDILEMLDQLDKEELKAIRTLLKSMNK